MRHLKKKAHLNKPADQRLALLKSLSRGLLLNGQITTTLSRAKALRPFIEKLLTKAIKANKVENPIQKLHYIRLIRKKLAADLLQALKEKAILLKERAGGYTRIVKTYHRRGDSTQMALIQILDN